MKRCPARRLPSLHTVARAACATALATALTACGGGAPGPVTAPPPQQALQISAAASNAEAGGAAIQLGATLAIAGDVSWSLGAGNPGALSASSGASVNYLPPASQAAPADITITATAGNASKSVQLRLYPAGQQPGLRLLAGDPGGTGMLDGSGSAARMEITSSGADSEGNLLTTEGNPANNLPLAALRKVSPAGVVSTLLMTPSAIMDGNAGTARLGRPICPAAGPAGSVYFVDAKPLDTPADSHAVPIRKLASDGSVTTVATVALAAGDHLCLLTDDSGKLYAWQDERISSVSGSGALSPLAGRITGASGQRPMLDGPGATARFADIASVAADRHGNLYVNDSGAVLRKVSAADGSVSTLAGALPAAAANGMTRPVDGAGSLARFSHLGALTVNGAGNLVATDYYQSGPLQELRLRTITPGGTVSSQLLPAGSNWRRLEAGPGEVLYVPLAAEVRMLRPDGSLSPFVGQATDSKAAEVDGVGAAARFSSTLLSMQADAAGNVYVQAGTFAGIHLLPLPGKLRKITPAGVVTTLPGVDSGQALSGYQVARDGALYMAGRAAGAFLPPDEPLPGGVVYRISPAGTRSILAGSSAMTSAAVDGAGTAARLVYPLLTGMDAEGNLYLQDKATTAATAATIYRRITPDGVVATIPALPSSDTPPVRDASGNTYSIDSRNGTIVRTTPAGVASVVAGTPGHNFNYGGALPGYLQLPSGLLRTGPYRFAIMSGTAIMDLVVPH